MRKEESSGLKGQLVLCVTRYGSSALCYYFITAVARQQMIATSNSLREARVWSSCVHAFSLPVNRLKNRVSAQNTLELTRGEEAGRILQKLLQNLQNLPECVSFYF